ncbi:CysZ-like protein [Sphingomonas haloaromaticamans]|uniref:CysZ-like protein n=2 Tax=Edaphosphingomonas haloaromaticamans TaxID=653954 RepID=A0A1S1H8E7_9SPHN|nr:CysZ-like protein [Sphingomonas haloaromaticamans]
MAQPGTGRIDRAMVRALMLSIGQLGDPRIRRVLVKSVTLTLAIFAVTGLVLGWALTGRDPCAIVKGYSCAIGSAEGGIAAALLVILGLWLLFPAIAVGVIGLFSDEVVAAVEERHYPAEAARARPPGWGEALRLGLGSAGRMIGYNLLALPFYLLLLLTAIGPVALFLVVNAIALGRDLDEMVAVRHLDAAARKARLAPTRGGRALTGLVAAGLFMIPVVNLLAPVIGAALATHRFHGSRG